MTNEQWKDKGICAECRRNSYCSKPCTVNKRVRRAAVNKMLQMHEDIKELAKQVN